jgi:hypothetical protein
LERLAKELVERTNYLNKDIEYLKNVNIIEYDIRSAGFTTLKYKKLLPSDEIQKLKDMKNDIRNIYIGKQIRKHPKIGEELINTLIDVRKDFVVLNQIMEDDILSIKKDALFLIKKEPHYLTVREIFEFRPKKKYTSYAYINGKEFYYSSHDDVLEVKGISKEFQEKQKDYFLTNIKKIFEMSEKLMPDQIFAYLQRYRSKYLARQLDKNVYRQLDTGNFVIRGDYKMDQISDKLVEDVDIVYNYVNYLVPLFRLLL